LILVLIKDLATSLLGTDGRSCWILFHSTESSVLHLGIYSTSLFNICICYGVFNVVGAPNFIYTLSGRV